MLEKFIQIMLAPINLFTKYNNQIYMKNEGSNIRIIRSWNFLGVSKPLEKLNKRYLADMNSNNMNSKFTVTYIL